MLAPRAWTPRLRRDLCTVWRGARRTAYADRTATGTTLPFTYSCKALSWIRKVVSTIRRTPAYRAVLKIKRVRTARGAGKGRRSLEGVHHYHIYWAMRFFGCSTGDGAS